MGKDHFDKPIIGVAEAFGQLVDPNSKSCTDIHGTQRTNPTDLGDPLTFPLAPP